MITGTSEQLTTTWPIQLRCASLEDIVKHARHALCHRVAVGMKCSVRSNPANDTDNTVLIRVSTQPATEPMAQNYDQ
jgi:hypothetical protein